jgi:hypothetical protein
MANPSDITAARALGRITVGDELETLRGEFNKLVVNLRVLTAKLDADAGVTDTNYGALVTDSSATGPAKVLVVVG